MADPTAGSPPAGMLLAVDAPHPSDPIGDRLYAAGLVGLEALDIAGKASAGAGRPASCTLPALGLLPGAACRVALSRLTGLAQQDLIAQPPDPALLAPILADPEQRADHLRWGAVPWRRRPDGQLLIACANPDPATLAALWRHHGTDCDFVLASPAALAWALRAPGAAAAPPPIYPWLTGFLLASLALAGLVEAPTVTATLIALAVLAAALLGAGQVIRLLLTPDSAVAARELSPPPPRDSLVAPAGWPAYHVLVAIGPGDEPALPDLARALRSLDYPHDRLTLHLALPADDITLLRALEAADLDQFGSLRWESGNPTLRLEAVVARFRADQPDDGLLALYRAGDRPAPDQLRRAALGFLQAPDCRRLVSRPFATDDARPPLPVLWESIALPRWLARGWSLPLDGGQHLRLAAAASTLPGDYLLQGSPTLRQTAGQDLFGLLPLGRGRGWRRLLAGNAGMLAALLPFAWISIPFTAIGWAITGSRPPSAWLVLALAGLIAYGAGLLGSIVAGIPLSRVPLDGLRLGLVATASSWRAGWRHLTGAGS